VPVIDKEKTKNKKPPICPYCEETIVRPSFVPEKGIEPEYRYMFCPECNALLAIIPMPSGEMDEKALNAIIRG
jgi:hypothetical protein